MKQIKSFTLIEMLIVLGIVAILSVTMVLAINPSEVQKKSRDTKRIKDLKTLANILALYKADGKTPTGCLKNTATSTPPYGCWSHRDIPEGAQSCSNNWLQENLCAYSANVPLDPINGLTTSIVTGGTVIDPAMGSIYVNFYYAILSGSDYEAGVRQESKSNAANVFNDGGDSTKWVEDGNNLKLMPP